MFFNREKGQKQILSVLTREPSLIHFIYGPINSGKTSLIMQILKSLPDDFIPFYVSLRGRNMDSSGDFMNLLFSIDRKSKFHNLKEYCKDIAKQGSKILKHTTGIPIPESIFDRLFKDKDKGEDAFKYMENFFMELVCEKNLKPVFVLDELQMIKSIVNSKGDPLLKKFFNFLIHLTKEMHICHCFAITSDSLFVNYICEHADLQGRINHILIDNLDKEQAFIFYGKFGFADKELVWNYLGGNIGDMIRLQTLVCNNTLTESLEEMLESEKIRLEMIKARLFEDDEQNYEKMLELLVKAGTEEHGIRFIPKDMYKSVVFWVNKNILFLNPEKGLVKMQTHLTKRAFCENL
jgi:uncharacterized protein